MKKLKMFLSCRIIMTVHTAGSKSPFASNNTRQGASNIECEPVPVTITLTPRGTLKLRSVTCSKKQIE